MAATGHLFDLLPDGIVLRILAQLSSTQAQLSGQRVCRRWRTLVRELRSCGGLATRVIVTCSGENQVAVIDPTLPSDRSVIQRFTPLPPRQKRPSRAKGHWRTCKGLFNWPTCMALGPEPGSLFVSQYRVRGVLRFDTDPSGTTYAYTRIAVTSPALESPEGLVASADGSLYVISVENCTCSHVSASGQVLQSVDLGCSTAGFRCAWGMSRAPRTGLGAAAELHIAVHVSDDGVYTSPTPEDTGTVIRLTFDEATGRLSERTSLSCPGSGQVRKTLHTLPRAVHGY